MLYVSKEPFLNSEINYISFSPEIYIDHRKFVIMPDAFKKTPIETVKCSNSFLKNGKQVLLEQGENKSNFIFMQKCQTSS